MSHSSSHEFHHETFNLFSKFELKQVVYKIFYILFVVKTIFIFFSLLLLLLKIGKFGFAPLNVTYTAVGRLKNCPIKVHNLILCAVRSFVASIFFIFNLLGVYLSHIPKINGDS